MVYAHYRYAFVSLDSLLTPCNSRLTLTSFPMYLPVNSENIGKSWAYGGWTELFEVLTFSIGNMNWSIVVIGAIILLPGLFDIKLLGRWNRIDFLQVSTGSHMLATSTSKRATLCFKAPVPSLKAFPESERSCMLCSKMQFFLFRE